MIDQRNSNKRCKFYLSYNYGAIIFYLFSILFIIYLGARNQIIYTFIPAITMFYILYQDVKSIAKIELNELLVKLIYRPFYKPIIFEYILSEIEMVSIYYSYKRCHSTILFIKLKDSTETIMHTTAMSIAKSKGIVEVLRNLNVNVIELEKPNVLDKIITLP
ncbi:MAG: hypothetical protein IPL31_10580 [Saprospiraceae bacterium]|nr:hypothetical protein [Saprospiraceae bacterium]